MLKSFDIAVLADIRTLPGSRRYPQFNKDQLAQSLADVGIRYIHFLALGGRRRPRPDSVNTAWHNKAFMGYADYMETEEFKTAAAELVSIAKREKMAYMCSEAVWWRCHRALLSDYLKVRGWEVIHIMGIGKSTEHSYTSARVQQGKLFYD